MHSESTLLDLIYEAGAVPDMWPGVLDRISQVAQSLGGVLFVADPVQTDWISSDGIRDGLQDYIAAGWPERNPRPRRLAALKHAGFLQDLDAFTEEELATEPVYTEFYRPRGLGWAAGTLLAMPSGENVVFSFECAYENGPVTPETIARLDGLRPHLARASLLSWRLGMRSAQAAAAALQAVGLPAAVLSRAGRLQAANAHFETLMPRSFLDGRERLALKDLRADLLLKDAVGRFAAQDGKAGIQSIPVAAAEGGLPLVLHLLPVKRRAQDIFSGSATILIAMPVDKGQVPHAEVLEALFDLTPTEARVARAIGQGEELKAVAAMRGVSPETVRAQLKSVLAKTGTRRQAELANLLGGLVPGPLAELPAKRSRTAKEL